jgi:superfamily I DNA/RNA helicase
MLNLSSLNPQQRQAVQTVHGPVLILAGAGTGKTRVITFRIAHLIERGVAPGHILGVTFTNKAAREMRDRVRKLVPRRAAGADPAEGGPPAASSGPTLCTFHSLCARILRLHIERLGYKRNFVIYDESDQLGTVRKLLARISAPGAKPDAAGLLAMLSRLRNAGESPPPPGDPNLRALAEHIRPDYESALRACNAVDFDDLILLALRLFSEHPEALDACRAHYRFVMVDEYQDTNSAQFKLVYALTREHRNLCVVGDDDQSIYGWRGAEVSNLLDMERYFPEVKVVKLEQNYRSTNTILSAANAVIRHNVRRRPKRLWSQKGEGPPIALWTFATEEEEARTVVERIQFARQAHRIPLQDQAILFRTNAQSRPLETALRKARLRYRLVGGQSFFDRREVRDLLAYLKTFVNPGDDASLLRIANVPPRGLSDATLERLLAASRERQCPVFTVMKNAAVTVSLPAQAQRSIEAFVDLVEQTRAQMEAPALAHDPRPLAAWAQRFLDRTGYLDDLRRSEKNPETADHRARSLQELVAALDGAETAALPPPARLERFLEDVALDGEREQDDDPGSEPAVTLITMHSCKGLEFPHVSIVGMEDGLLPHTRSKDEGTLDEERRLFYVAITRAMQTLAISHCLARSKYGKPTPCHPSPFLKDLPPELVERGDDKAKQPVSVEAARTHFDVVRAATDWAGPPVSDVKAP